MLQSLFRPVLRPIMMGVMAVTGSRRAWSPLALWPDGVDSPGMWISPSTLPASFNDYTGTTPVAVPGTVADSSNPVGLALDIRAGAPDTRGPELCVGAPVSLGDWTNNGDGTFTPSSSHSYISWGTGGVAGKTYLMAITITDYVSGWVASRQDDWVPFADSNGTFTALLTPGWGTQFYGGGSFKAAFSVREVPGHHMLQATAAARPLESAYDGQTLGPGNTYDATGYPVFQLYDGVDDGMATATFAAGTLINGMDCMIPVRRDSGTLAVVGLWDSINTWFAVPDSTDSVQVCYGSCGAPTVWVDGVQLAGGTSVKRDTLAAALTIGDWHIMEFRGLDLSSWTSLNFGAYFGFNFNGARGDIMLFPSTASTEDKDAARQYLADKYGVTLA